MDQAATAGGLGVLDYGVVAVYLLGMFGLALVFARQHGSTEEFFLGNRRMPWWAIGLSILATLMSTVSYLALPGEMLKHGIGMFLQYLAIPFSFAVILFLLVPFFMRLRLTSAYEYLELRFNYPARLVAAVLFTLLRFGWMGVVVYTSSLALSTMTGYSIEGIILVVGFFATIYTAVGGFRAVVWTDVVQFIVLFGGAAITVGYIWYSTQSGPTEWWDQASQLREAHTSPPLWSFDLTLRITVITVVARGFIWTICTHGSDQVVLQRYFSTSSLKAAGRSYIVNVIADLSVVILLGLCGLALLAFYLKNPGQLPLSEGVSSLEYVKTNADKIFPYFIANALPPGVGGLIVAALVAAAMSSIDSGVNAIAAVVTTDVIERKFPQVNQKVSPVALARTLTLVTGAIATAAAFWILQVTRVNPDINIVELMPKGFNMFLGPLAALFFIGMFIPTARSGAAITGSVVGFLMAVVWSYWSEIFGTSWTPTYTLAIAVPFVASLVVAAVISFFEGSIESNPGRDYHWWAVLKQPAPTSEDD